MTIFKNIILIIINNTLHMYDNAAVMKLITHAIICVCTLYCVYLWKKNLECKICITTHGQGFVLL
jgi:hypothetical protein